MSVVTLGFTLASEEEHGRHDDPGPVHLSFLQGLQVEDDDACIALHFLAAILKDDGTVCGSQWVQGSSQYSSLFLDAFYYTAFKLFFQHSVDFGATCLHRIDP